MPTLACIYLLQAYLVSVQQFRDGVVLRMWDLIVPGLSGFSCTHHP